MALERPPGLEYHDLQLTAVPNLADNLRALSTVKSGDRIADVLTASRINAMQDVIRAVARGETIKGGVGVGKRTVAEGVLITVDVPPAQGPSVPAGPQPFDVSFTPIDSTTQYAHMRPGTMNGIIPDNHNFNIPQYKSGYVYYLKLVVTMSGTPLSVSNLTTSFDNTAPTGIPTTAGGPPTSWSYLVGAVVEGVWYRTIGPGSLVAIPAESYRVSQSSPTPGTLPYTIYYTMDVSAA